MSNRQRLMDISNALYGLHDDLWPQQQELRGLCETASLEVKAARNHIEQAMNEIDKVLGIDDA